MKRAIIFIFICLSAVLSVISQTANQPLVLQSPEASSLMKEVTTPVSLSSGTTTVEIPVYSLKHGDIVVPVSLSYDASGVKVDAQPTWVGQNWSLKAGGMISRIVKGIPDETYVEEEIYLQANGQNHIVNRYATGLFYNTGKLQNSNWNTTSQIENWAKNEHCELEPDEFIFNFCGHTGKFYMSENGNLVSRDKKYRIDILIYNNIPMYDGRMNINPNRPESFTYYKSNMMSNGMSGYIGGFVRWRVSRIMGFCITDSEGVKYYFGSYYKDENDGNVDIYTDLFREIEITADFFSQFFEEEFSTWYLERIVSPCGNTVEFKYEVDGQPTVSFSSNYSVNKMSGSASSGLGWIFGGKVSASNFYAGQNLSGKFIRPVFLSEIRTPNNSIRFNRSNANNLKYNYEFIHTFLARAIENYDPYLLIPVYEGQSPISFYYNRIRIIDYTMLKTCKLDNISIISSISNDTIKQFKFGYQEGNNTRLRLLSVTEQSNGASLPATGFEYNAMQLPGYLDIRNDHWGYYNNKMAQVDYASTSGMENYYNLREPDFTYTKAGILEKIKYSTGGSKEIRYEPNKYNRIIKRNTGTGALSIQSCPEKVGGGLRVKEMIENDGTNSYTKRYSYSPGILNGEIQYYWNNYRGKLLNGNTYTADRFFTNSMLPVSGNSEGGSVSYTGVMEQNVGNGRTEYIFSNHDNTIDENSVSIDLQKSPYSPLSSKVVERGKLLETKIYKEGASAPFSKETYQYSVPDNNREYVRAVYLRRLALFNTYEINAIEGSAYKIYIYNYNITKRTDTVYYSNSQNPLTTQTAYDYNSYNQLIATTTTNSDGKTLATGYDYAWETYPELGMLNRHILSPVALQTDIVVNPASNISNYVVKMLKNEYRIENDFPVLSKVSVGKNAFTLETEADYTKYDSKGNLLQKTGRDNAPVTYLWGYNYQYPIAEIENAGYSDVCKKAGNNNENAGKTALNAITAKNEPSAADWNTINGLRASLPNALITIYKYNPLVGIKEIINPRGAVTTCEYDAFGRLQTVKDHNSNVVENYDYHYKN